MSFEYGNGNKVFDLCLFLTCSLDKACTDYKIINSKSKFDHKLIKTWADTEKYRKQVEPYLDLDVLALKELFEKFNDLMFSKFKVNISSYLSAGHMGYSIWSSLLEHIVEIPNDMDKYRFISKATYGARCYPQQKKYKSATFEKLRKTLKGKDLYNALLKSGDFIFNCDATSLYPASMRGFDLVKVKYPTGVSRWSDKPEQEYKSGKIGMYEIDYVSPTNIRVPILPEKKYDKTERFMGISWNLNKGSGIFTSTDIQNAKDAGYEISFKNKCLVWDEQEEIFNKYIDSFFKMKDDAEKNDNDVERNVAKLFLNSLYGKTLQKAIFNTTKIVNNVFEFNKFVTEHNLTDFKVINKNKLMVSGEIKDGQKTDKITKPCQLGAFVLAYSRRIMLHYIKAIDTTLKSCVFTYSDTDSLHITGENYFKLLAKGYIKEKSKAQLGYLCSDIKNEGLIFYEKNLAPKCYSYSYVDNKGDIKEKENAILKCKGLPKRCLSEDLYESEVAKELEFEGLQKKHKNLTIADKEAGVAHFSIINKKQKRTFNKSSWKGMDFDDQTGQWYPFNYSKDT
jgi:hypothetical protein